MSLFSSDYYSNDAQAHSFTHKLAGLAKLTGVVAVGLVASRPLLTSVGRAGIGIAKILGQDNEGALSKLIGGRFKGGAIESTIQEFVSDESRVVYDIADHVERSGVTFATNEKRTTNFISSLRDHVHPESLEAFDAAKDKFIEMTTEVGRASKGYETEATFLKDNIIHKFNAQAGRLGVKFQFEDIRQQQRVFRNLIDESVDVAASRKSLNDLMANPENRRSILDFAREGVRFHSERTKAIPKIFNFGDRVKQLTWAEIKGNKQYEAEVNKFLENVGHPTREGHHTVDSMVGEVRKKAEKLFLHVHEGEEHGAKEVAEMMDIFHHAQSGFAVTVDKQGRNTGAVSLAQFNNVKKRFVDKALEQVQIPLVPYTFGIPLKTFRGVFKPAGALVKNLGHISKQSEIKRMLGGKFGELSAHTQVISSGDRLLAVDPTTNKIGMVEGKFTTFRRADNTHWDKLADIRSQDVDSWTKNFTNFKDKEARSRQANFIFSRLPIFSDVAFSSQDGWGVVPKEGKKPFNSLISRLYRGTSWGLNLEELHPLQVSQFLDSSAGELNGVAPREVNRAFGYAIDEGKQQRFNLAGTLKRAINNKDIEVDFDASFDGVTKRLMNNADNVDTINETLGITMMNQSEPLTEMTSTLKHSAAAPYTRSIYSLRDESTRSGLGIKSDVEGGIWQNIANKFTGKDEIGSTMQSFQEGLLSQLVHGMGIAKLNNGALEGEITKEIETLAQNAHGIDWSEHTNTAFYKAAKSIGYEESNMSSLLGKMFDVKFSAEGVESRVANRAAIGEFGSLLLTKEDVLKVSNESVVHMKIMDSLHQNLHIVDDLGLTKQNEMLYQMSQDFELTKALKQRFIPGQNWHPKDERINPFASSRFMALPNSFQVTMGEETRSFTSLPSIYELANMTGTERHAYLKGQLQRGFGIGDFVSGLTHPDKELGTVGAVTQIMLQMPNNIGSELGLGLSAQDRVTALRSVGGMLLKRALPVAVGYEAYKNLNANLHHYGFNGIDDSAANILANANIASAGVKDSLGITDITKQLVSTLPGLDQYFHPRSEKEYRDYLFYGDEGVRDGRGWMIGSRSALTGGAINDFRPNFYRRWKSHWTEASNVDISNPYYSWLPNLQNPFAPAMRMTHPDWWVNKHRADRPYHQGGQMKSASPFEDSGFVINSDPAITGAGGAAAVGSFGGQYPATMSVGSGRGGGGIGGVGQEATPGGGAAHLYYNKQVREDLIGKDDTYNAVASVFEGARHQAGVFGLAMAQIPFYPHHKGEFQAQEAGKVTSMGRMLWMSQYGEGTGAFGEYLRRMFPEEHADLNAYNPLPNNQGSWLPGNLRTGDPYMRVKGIGELSLPGEAYERTHPWVAPLKVRGSVIGGSEKEILDAWLNPMKELDGPDAEDIVGFGSEAHKLIQRQMEKQGILVAAETSIYDSKHNISGTIDAIVRGETGNEIIDIKTQGEKSWGHTPEKYIDQINTYMAITGINRAHLVFVNRDNMSQQRVETFNFDETRWENTLAKVEHVRDTVQGMIDQGAISPFETYDLISRIEVLSRTAPDSAEFKRAVSFAEKHGGFSGFERQRFDQAIAEAKELRKDFNLYPYRYNRKQETRKVTVRGVTPNGDIITEMGVVKLAGVKWDKQAFVYDDADMVLGKFGIYKGKKISVTMLEGQFNPEVMGDTPLEAIVGDTNKEIMHSRYGSPDTDGRGPLSYSVVHGNHILPRLWENLVHKDNIITNKFMRVRSPLEQFERGEVYGTDKAQLSHVWSTVVSPTLSSLAHGDPISSAIKGAIIGGAFFTTKEARIKGAAVAAAGAAALSFGRMGYELITGNKWVPSRYTKQGDFDEYWDDIEFIKETAIAEKAKQKAAAEEGTNIDRLNANDERQDIGLGPWGVLAIEAEKKARRTMYGFEVATGSLQEALAAIPQRHRQIAEEIIQYGTLKEKQKFYNELNKAEQRVLGKFLNIDTDDLPDRVNLEEFFKKHYLPNSNWKGWGIDTDTKDLEARSAFLNKNQIDKPSRERVEKSRARTNDISIPRIDNPTAGNIKNRIQEILHSGGFVDLDVDYVIRPSSHHVVNVKADVFEDSTHEMMKEVRDGLS